MKKIATTISSVVGIFLLFFGPHLIYGRGFGGGFGGGGFSGGGYRGGYGGGFQRGGYNAGGYSGGGYHPSGLQDGTPRDGYSAGYNALPTDAGFGGAGYGGRSLESGGYHAGEYAGGGYRAAGAEAAGVRPVAVEAGGYRPGAVGAEGAAERTAVNRTEAIPNSVAAERASAVRDSFQNYGMFDSGWFSEHPKATFGLGWRAGRNNAWNTATWPYVGQWYGWPEYTEPYYYDYGNNINYENGQVYCDGQPVATTEEYYQQASALAQSAPAIDPNSTDWLPLGVFSLVHGNQSETNTVMQLATNKSGAIAGNCHSVATGSTLPIQGAVDKKTQRAAWTVGYDKNRVYDTGISNLTKDEAPILVHLGSNITQQWMLVRLKQPQ